MAGRKHHNPDNAEHTGDEPTPDKFYILTIKNDGRDNPTAVIVECDPSIPGSTDDYDSLVKLAEISGIPLNALS